MTSPGLVPPRGRLIVVEGGDACGKNTQAVTLHRRLNSLIASVPAMFVSFPRYNTPLGQAILRHLKDVTSLREHGSGSYQLNNQWSLAPEDKLVFQCMMTADKYHAAADIEAHLARGGHVVCDRWWQSAYVYGLSDGLDGKWLRDVHRFLPEADVSILIDVPAQMAAERRPVARDRYEESMSRRETVRRLYIEAWSDRRAAGSLVPSSVARSHPIIDGTRSIDEVAESVWQAIASYVDEAI